jgi:hypothetical protein
MIVISLTILLGVLGCLVPLVLYKRDHKKKMMRISTQQKVEYRIRPVQTYRTFLGRKDKNKRDLGK